MYTNSIGQQLQDKLDMAYTNSIEAQKNCAKVALKLLGKIGLNPMILGGAPRDWLHDRPAKDLDIYIQFDGCLMATIDKIQSALFLNSNEIVDITTTSDYLKNKDNGVLFVFNILNLAMPVQIILCDRKPKEMLNIFMGSLSQAFATYNKDNDTLDASGTYTFKLGQKFKVHFLHKTDDPAYIAKVANKYPDYQLIVEA